MPSERIQRQVDALLDEAEAAIRVPNWARVRELCDSVLRLDPGNEDAKAFLEAAGRGGPLVLAPLAGAGGPQDAATPSAARSTQHGAPLPVAFAAGRGAPPARRGRA